ncbi:M1 family aminopeptidase [Phenylobacterium sp.]|uniref:ABC transporter permease/M1 family aminopeptidase n=1 Tax=Phenylobacterium sp. TaxID=1871053 RepID=UPI0011FBDA7F|nr:M1 family aminopeptidase [Phenylobacterium sp.]THD61592.1 MAG: aminopeptidase [Phenylobacterium sp.]
MFFKIASFEFRYQTRQPVFWVAVIIFALLAFGAVASDNIQLGNTANVHKNAPWVIAQSSLIFAVIYMFVTTAFVANVVVRDDDTGYGPLIYSTRVSKFDYLYGRFTGAYLAAALSFLAVPVGFFLGSLMPWVDKETIGPLFPGAYAFAYFYLALPVLFLSSAIFFTLATVTRSMMWAYVGVVGFIILRSVFSLVLSRQGLETTAALWEPNGISAFSLATRYWTASERNAMVPAIGGYILWNKLLWTGIGFGVLALAYRLFRFETGKVSRDQKKAARLAAAEETAAPAPHAGPLPKPVFNAATARAQLWARTWLDLGQVFKSPAYFVLLALAALLSVVNLWLSTDISLYGGRTYPVTRVMIQALAGIFSFMSIIIAIYYAGELVWREREKKTGEIIDATAVPDWAFIVPKTLAISLVLISSFVMSMAVAMIVQAIKGYFGFAPLEYLLWWIVPQSIDAILIAVLAIFIQALVPHKFVGWGVMVLYLISTVVLNNLGLEDVLYQYGLSPDVPISDMNGQGHFWIGPYALRLYWSALALVLTVLAYGLWRRGSETRFGPRLRRLPGRLKGPAGALLALGLAAFVGMGGYIYLNTHVWNPYRTHLDDERFLADYEKALWRFHDTPQPTVTAVKLDVALYPHDPKVVTRGSYQIQNRTGAPLSEVHVRFADRDLKVRELSVQGARQKTDFGRFNYRVFAFDQPMAPGETRTIGFTTERAQRGFKNSRNWKNVVDNGTFLNNYDVAPVLGMDRNLLLTDRSKRRKYGLPPELRPPKLGDPSGARHNALRSDSDWVSSDITLSTVADQIPIAPGYKVSETVSGGRRTAHFVSDSPMMNFFSLQSAKYAVKTETYRGVAISVYYDPQHPWNVERMIRTAKAGLDYFDVNFSPYQFRQLRFLEFPDFAGSFAQSFANTVPWSEGLVFIADNDSDPSRIDMVTYVGAHELGHQWWGHQAVSADEQGDTMLIETFAQYSALMVMKHMYGPDMIRKFLKYELDSYLKARGGEALEELPLEKVENQGYIHYRKGSLVMYRLQDEIGEDAVNAALRKYLHDYAFKPAPYPNAAELVADFRAVAPPNKQQLITDLFEKITLYDFKAKTAVARKRPDGQWDVILTIDAKKLYANGQGQETEAPLTDEVVDIGVFTAEPGKKDFSAKDVLFMKPLSVKTGTQTYTVTVPKKPLFAGVDPYNKRIDRNSDDNTVKVTGG